MAVNRVIIIYKYFKYNIFIANLINVNRAIQNNKFMITSYISCHSLALESG